LKRKARVGWVPALVLMVLAAAAAQAGEGAVALQSADPSCADDSGDIYVDCGNGTATDNRTGLVWLKNADCLNAVVDWHQAMMMVSALSDQESPVEDCNLADGSSPGEWRLPSVAEWETMIADAEALGCEPAITDDQGTGCWNSDPLVCVLSGRSCSFSGVQATYWSPNTRFTDPLAGWAWIVHLSGPLPIGPGNSVKTNHYAIWPVRGGQ